MPRKWHRNRCRATSLPSEEDATAASRTTAVPSQPFRFFDLPPEIRALILRELLLARGPNIWNADAKSYKAVIRASIGENLAAVSPRFRDEAERAFFNANRFFLMRLAGGSVRWGCDMFDDASGRQCAMMRQLELFTDCSPGYQIHFASRFKSIRPKVRRFAGGVGRLHVDLDVDIFTKSGNVVAVAEYLSTVLPNLLGVREIRYQAATWPKNFERVRLQEVLVLFRRLVEVVENDGRPLKVYWETAKGTIRQSSLTEADLGLESIDLESYIPPNSPRISEL